MGQSSGDSDGGDDSWHGVNLDVEPADDLRYPLTVVMSAAHAKLEQVMITMRSGSDEDTDSDRGGDGGDHYQQRR